MVSTLYADDDMNRSIRFAQDTDSGNRTRTANAFLFGVAAVAFKAAYEAEEEHRRETSRRYREEYEADMDHRAGEAAADAAKASAEKTLAERKAVVAEARKKHGFSDDDVAGIEELFSRGGPDGPSVASTDDVKRFVATKRSVTEAWDAIKTSKGWGKYDGWQRGKATPANTAVHVFSSLKRSEPIPTRKAILVKVDLFSTNGERVRSELRRRSAEEVKQAEKHVETEEKRRGELRAEAESFMNVVTNWVKRNVLGKNIDDFDPHRRGGWTKLKKETEDKLAGLYLDVHDSDTEWTERQRPKELSDDEKKEVDRWNHENPKRVMTYDDVRDESGRHDIEEHLAYHIRDIAKRTEDARELEKEWARKRPDRPILPRYMRNEDTTTVAGLEDRDMEIGVRREGAAERAKALIPVLKKTVEGIEGQERETKSKNEGSWRQRAVKWFEKYKKKHPGTEKSPKDYPVADKKAGDLRALTIRLAQDVPELRRHLVPLLRQGPTIRLR